MLVLLENTNLQDLGLAVSEKAWNRPTTN